MKRGLFTQTSTLLGAFDPRSEVDLRIAKQNHRQLRRANAGDLQADFSHLASPNAGEREANKTQIGDVENGIPTN